MRAREGAYADATGLACGKSHAIRPWPEKRLTRVKNGWLANKTPGIYSLQKGQTDVHRNSTSPRQAAMAISKLLDLSRGSHLDR